MKIRLSKIENNIGQYNLNILKKGDIIIDDIKGCDVFCSQLVLHNFEWLIVENIVIIVEEGDCFE